MPALPATLPPRRDSATAMFAAGHIASALPTLHEFPSGLTLLVQENRSNPTLSLAGLMPAGAVDDAPGLRGAGNLAVGMLLNGTTQHTKLELAAQLEDDAMSLSFGLGRENSSISARCLSEDWPKLLALLAEVLRQPAFPDDELAKLRKQTLAGLLHSRNDTFEVAFYHARDALYGAGHPFAGRAEGSEDSVRSIPREALAQWWSSVSPRGMVLALVGDIDTQRAIADIGAALEGWGAAARERGPLLARGHEISLPEPREQRLPLPDKNSVSLVWMGHGAPKTSEAWPARMVANYICGGDFQARLNQRLRVRDGLTYGSYSWFSNGLAPGPWCAKAEVAADNVDRAIAAAADELARYSREGATADELELAQDYLCGNFPVRLSSNGAIAGVLAEAVYLGRGLDYIHRYPALVRGVTREQVAQAAAEFMDPAQLLLVACGTFK